MDLAAAAVGIIASFLQTAAGRVGERAADDGAEAVYGIVAAKMRETEVGASLMARMEQQPADTEAQRAVAEAVNAGAVVDAEFASRLQAGVEAVVAASQGAGGPGSTSIADAQITSGGAVTTTHTAIAGAGAQGTRVGTGGMAAIFIAVALWLGGVTTVAVVVVQTVAESPEEVAESYIETSFGGQFEEAAEYLCYPLRREVESGGFDASGFVASSQEWEEADPQLRYETERESDSTATVRVDISALVEGERVEDTFRVDLLKEDGDWKVCDIRD
jgi:hypothetical protein